MSERVIGPRSYLAYTASVVKISLVALASRSPSRRFNSPRSAGVPSGPWLATASQLAALLMLWLMWFGAAAPLL